jgi:hypothetical protein
MYWLFIIFFLNFLLKIIIRQFMINLLIQSTRLYSKSIISYFKLIDKLDEKFSNGDLRVSMPLRHCRLLSTIITYSWSSFALLTHIIVINFLVLFSWLIFFLWYSLEDSSANAYLFSSFDLMRVSNKSVDVQWRWRSYTSNMVLLIACSCPYARLTDTDTLCVKRERKS